MYLLVGHDQTLTCADHFSGSRSIFRFSSRLELRLDLGTIPMPYRTGQSENLATFLLRHKNPRKSIELAETHLIFARRPNGRSNQFSRYLRRRFRSEERRVVKEGRSRWS